MPSLAWYGCGRVSWTPDARVRVSQWLHSHAATKAFPCLDLEDADPCDYLKVTQTIFSWPMEQTQHHQVLANGPPPLKYLGLLPTHPGGMPRRLPRGFAETSVHPSHPHPRLPRPMRFHYLRAARHIFVFLPGFLWSFPLPFAGQQARLPSSQHVCTISSLSARPLSGFHTALSCRSLLCHPVAAVPRFVTRTTSQVGRVAFSQVW